MGTSTVKPLMLSARGKHAGAHKLGHTPHHTPHTADIGPHRCAVKRYILVHPRDTHLPYLSDAPHCISRTLNDTTTITFVDLTDWQAKEVGKHLSKVNGTIEPNGKITLDYPLPPEEETVADESVAATSIYPSAPINCPAVTMGADFILFFPDTMINKSKFPKANLSIGNNYSGTDKPCNPHSDYTFSIFEQVIADPKLQAVNIPVFTCGGGSLTDAVMNGFMDILNYAQANPTKKVGMYCAISGGGPNAAFTSVVQELVKAGVMVSVSAGNNGFDICKNNIPPWNVAGVLQIGGTQSPGERCPYFTNWSDVAPNPQFGDCVNAYLPSVFTIKKFNVKEQGTSFAIPQATAWVMRWWNQNPSASAAQAIQAFKDHTVLITKGGPSYYPPLTASGQIRVVTKANYCNTNVTISSPKP